MESRNRLFTQLYLPVILDNINVGESGWIHYFLVFRLNERRYALDLSELEEIVRLREDADKETGRVTKFSIDRSGEIVPLVRLNRHIGLPDPEDSGPGDVLILKAGDTRYGFRVDAAESVLGINDSCLCYGSNPDMQYIRGKYVRGNNELYVLDSVLLLQSLFMRSVERRVPLFRI